MKTIFFALTLLLIRYSVYADFLTFPYIQGLNDNSAYVLIESSTQDTVFVDYGLTIYSGFTAKTTIISATTAVPATYVHKILLTGLCADTIIFISVRQAGSITTSTSFRSIASSGRSFKWAWIADSQYDTTVFNSIMERILPKGPHFIIHGGDVADEGTYRLWKSQFFTNSARNVLMRTPSFLAVGNHEGWEQNTKAFTQSPVSRSGNQPYYSFDYGDIHFLILNTQLPYAIGSEQFNFAANDLSNTKKRWKIVCSHKPGFIIYENSEKQQSNQDMINLFTRVFEPNNVDIVLSGHNHLYQHLKLNNIDHFIIGSAGGVLDPIASAPYVVKSASSYCFGIFESAPQVLKLTVYSLNNKIIDTLIWFKLEFSGIKLPAGYSLSQNYPNPFNSFTTIKYDVLNAEKVTIKVYDILGNEIRTLVNEHKDPGYHSILFDGSNLSSGVYIYKIIAGVYISGKKMMVIK
ncbi:MAG: metallophosphoesterase [Bacteroidota bacterium]|nr:metallophosphoesterase [Bacteroidota bacterium]